MAQSLFRRLGPWRRTFQWCTSLLLLLIPFVRIDGGSLLRLDLPGLELHFFGTTFHIEELYLLLLLAFCLLLLFLLVTLAFGRAWCGWACPQTTLSDLSEALARRLGLGLERGRFVGAAWRRALLQLALSGLALLVGANLTWYFISPYDFFARLGAGTLPPTIYLPLLATAVVVYLDLALLRRLFCREFCPYGRFQTVLVDPGTLTLRFHPDHADRCIRCGACVRACPMDIDIRRGYQVECINCGRCLDACREVMARRGQTGIIRYTFGLEGRGLTALVNPRMLLVSVAFLALFGGLIFASLHRAEASLKLARSRTAASRQLADGQVATFFTAIVGNRSRQPLQLTLVARDSQGRPLKVRGPVASIRLQPDQRQKVDFVLLTPPARQRSSVDFILRDPRGKILADSRAYLEPLARSHP